MIFVFNRGLYLKDFIDSINLFSYEKLIVSQFKKLFHSLDMNLISLRGCICIMYKLDIRLFLKKAAYKVIYDMIISHILRYTLCMYLFIKLTVQYVRNRVVSG